MDKIKVCQAAIFFFANLSTDIDFIDSMKCHSYILFVLANIISRGQRNVGFGKSASLAGSNTTAPLLTAHQEFDKLVSTFMCWLPLFGTILVMPLEGEIPVTQSAASTLS